MKRMIKSIIILFLLVIVVLIGIIKPYNEPDIIGSISTGSTNKTTYNITVNAFTIFDNDEDVKNSIIEHYNNNDFNSVIFSTDYTNEKEVNADFTVYRNNIYKYFNIVWFTFNC